MSEASGPMALPHVLYDPRYQVEHGGLLWLRVFPAICDSILGSHGLSLPDAEQNLYH